MPRQHRSSGPTRRDVVKRGLYVAPAIVSLSVSPSFAQVASGGGTSKGKGKGKGKG
jgi:hypothetical protein